MHMHQGGRAICLKLITLTEGGDARALVAQPGGWLRARALFISRTSTTVPSYSIENCLQPTRQSRILFNNTLQTDIRRASAAAFPHSYTRPTGCPPCRAGSATGWVPMLFVLLVHSDGDVCCMHRGETVGVDVGDGELIRPGTVA